LIVPLTAMPTLVRLTAAITGAAMPPFGIG